jgi:DNA replication protein DnaC
VRGAAEAARPNEAAREAVIAEHLKALKLPSFGREYQSLARRAADGGWAYEDYLRELLEVELSDREERTANRLLKAAKFPDLKTLDQLDWTALKGVSRQKIMQLASSASISPRPRTSSWPARSEPARPTSRSL